MEASTVMNILMAIGVLGCIIVFISIFHVKSHDLKIKLLIIPRSIRPGP